MRLGPSQKAVLKWIREHPESKAQEVGDALYDEVCETNRYGGYGDLKSTEKQLHRRWASRILQRLKKLGLVIDDMNQEKWSATIDGDLIE